MLHVAHWLLVLLLIGVAGLMAPPDAQKPQVTTTIYSLYLALWFCTEEPLSRHQNSANYSFMHCVAVFVPSSM